MTFAALHRFYRGGATWLAPGAGTFQAGARQANDVAIH